MTTVARSVQETIREFNPNVASVILENQLRRGAEGNSIVALAIACERPRRENLNWLLPFLAEFSSRFEHFWTIRALLLHEQLLDPDSARNILETLKRLMPEIEKDPGRIRQAQQLQSRAVQILHVPPPSSDAAL